MARIPKYIRVTNFEKHQHGGERRKDLPWLKLYIATLTDIELMSLPTPTFKLFICLLLLAQRTDNRVTSDVQKLAKTMHMTNGSVTQGLQELLRNGFIEPFRVETESRQSLALVDKRREEPPNPPSRGARKQTRQRPTGWRAVRGSHGASFVADPEGTDRPPAWWAGSSA